MAATLAGHDDSAEFCFSDPRCDGFVRFSTHRSCSGEYTTGAKAAQTRLFLLFCLEHYGVPLRTPADVFSDVHLAGNHLYERSEAAFEKLFVHSLVSSEKEEVNMHPVAVVQPFADFFHPQVHCIVSGAGLDLSTFGLFLFLSFLLILLSPFLLQFILFVLIFSLIGDTGDRRYRPRCYFDEVQICVRRAFQSFPDRNNPDVVAVGINETDFRYTDGLINTCFPAR